MRCCKQGITGETFISLIFGLALGCAVLTLALKSYTLIYQSYFEIEQKKIIIRSAKTCFNLFRDQVEKSGYWGVRSKDPSYPVYQQQLTSKYSYYSPIIIGNKESKNIRQYFSESTQKKLLRTDADWLLLNGVPEQFNEGLLVEKNEPSIFLVKPSHYKLGERLVFSNEKASIAFKLNKVSNNKHQLLIPQDSLKHFKPLANHHGQVYCSKDYLFYLHEPVIHKTKDDFVPVYDLYQQNISHPSSASPIVSGISDMYFKIIKRDNDNQIINDGLLNKGLNYNRSKYVEINLLFFIKNRGGQKKYTWRGKSLLAPVGYQAVTWQYVLGSKNV